MTREQFHARLKRLILAGHRSGLCPACCLQELLGASEAVVTLSGLTADDLDAHGISNAVLMPAGTFGQAPPYDRRH